VRLTLLLDMAADGFGDRVVAGRRSGGITASGLARRSHSGAARLRQRGADALVYLDVNGPAFPVALPDPAVRARLSSVGQPLPGVELEVRGPGGEVLGPGQTGRICVRGGQVSAEYAGLGRALDDRGFFDTRDEGYLDADGYLFVCGRADDTIIRGAENIAPAEIEDVLLRHPAVLDAVVFGVPDQEWGQRIEAAVVPRPETDLDLSDLREFTLRTLRSSKTPDHFWILGELPRTETGKLLRRMVPGLVATDVN